MHEAHIPQHLAAYLHDYGEWAVFAIILLESLGAPLPGESLLIAAFSLAARGLLDPPLLFLGTFAAAVLGDNIGYLIGRLLGRQAVIRFGTRVGVTAERYEWAEAQFSRYGPAIVAGARFVVILRQLNGIVAGSLGMHWLRFLIFNAIGAALWVGFWGALAMFVGTHVHAFAELAQHLGVAGVLIALVAAIAALAWWRWRQPRKTGGTQ
ncbi:DedA family protein [Rhodoligotrophos defluvii]|uniref:DedA family protein n=1 Tax=Rhodoligotrophos defluvii TaxID=2561934 RepID=UPI0010C9B9C8|nr:DedA family protein [Rhodoligotrophos defluvii]